MGVEDVGIPGAGEPLLPRNRKLTFKILEKCKDLGFYVTLFTTGEFINEEIANRLYRIFYFFINPKYQLVNKLLCALL